MKDLEKRAVKTAGAGIAPTLTAYQDVKEEEGKTALEVSDFAELTQGGEEVTDSVHKKIIEGAGNLLKNTVLPK